LADFSGQIAGLIPIMQTDYDEYHTANLHLITGDQNSTTSPIPSTHRVHGFRGNGPNGLFHLKRELYSLKDQLSECIEELLSYVEHSPECNNRIRLQKLLGSYRVIKSSLGMILSNHASDWIEYGLAGGMTYPEFCRLNPDTISSLNLQLKDVVQNLGDNRLRLASLRYLDADSVLDDQTLETRKTDLDALQAIEEVLVFLFQIKN
jgi:hypothetical protein